jgi:hypothetical protein
VAPASHHIFAMTNTRTVDNSERPGQPEPGEDPATQAPSVREDASEADVSRDTIENAKRRERERQTGE